MKVSKVVLVCSVVLTILIAFNLFAAIPTPTPEGGSTPTLMPTPTRVVTPTPLPPTPPKPTLTPSPTPTPIRYYKYYKNIDGHNNIGTANDLEVYLEGNQTGRMDYWNRPNFPYWNCYYDPVSDRTIVRFYGTTVQYCDYVMACLKSDLPIKEVARRTWTRDGVPIGSMDPVLSTSYRINQRQLTITFGNYVQGGGTVTLRGFQYGLIYRVYDLSELSWEYLQNKITWISIPDFQPEISEGATQESPTIFIPDNAVGIIYYAQSGPIDEPVIYIEQYTPFQSFQPTPTPPGYGYVVTYTTSIDWGGGATVNVIIKNNTVTPVNGWTLAWTFPGNQVIVNMWSAIPTQNGASVSAKDAEYNAVIPPNGGQVSFGFNINYSGTNEEPANFTLNGVPCQVQ